MRKADADRRLLLAGLMPQRHAENAFSLEAPAMSSHAPAHDADNSLVSLLRIPQVLSMTGLTRAALYKRAAAGYFVRPVKACGTKRAGWPSDEVQTIIRAHIRGASEVQIADLVSALHERRQSHGPLPELRAA
jgi:predicted DNA-binding transcriptional regulator AlpA